MVSMDLAGSQAARPLFGEIADRRRPTMLIAVLSVGCAVILAVGALILHANPTAWMVLVFCALCSVLTAALDHAEAGLLPRLFGSDEGVLMRVNSYVSGINQVFGILLPFVGAGLFATIAVLLLGIDALLMMRSKDVERELPENPVD